MKNDGYIHRNLLRHMLRAGLIEEAQQLITDLKWLAAKLDVTGPADLLNDYLAVKGHEDSKVTTQHHKECFKWPMALYQTKLVQLVQGVFISWLCMFFPRLTLNVKFSL